MFRTAFLILLSLAIAFAVGVSSLWLALDRFGGLSRTTIGEWSTEPDAGTVDADPYSRARAARDASVPLGHAEGIVFVATTDHDGLALRRQCNYRIDGPVPPARFYTLHARDDRGLLIPTGNLRTPALHSGQLLRNANGSATVNVGPSPQAGNWLPLTGSGPMKLVLTFYDTPVVANVSVTSVALPTIRLAGCNG